MAVSAEQTLVVLKDREEQWSEGSPLTSLWPLQCFENVPRGARRLGAESQGQLLSSEPETPASPFTFENLLSFVLFFWHCLYR